MAIINYDITQPAVYGQPSFSKIKTSPEHTRYIGTIKSYDAEKGFGFIICKNYEIYFSKYQIKSNKIPKHNEPVSFSILNTNKGYQAINVNF
jgi:cold shock CspA family protein